MGYKMDHLNDRQLLKLQPHNITWESNKQQQQAETKICEYNLTKLLWLQKGISWMDLKKGTTWLVYEKWPVEWVNIKGQVDWVKKGPGYLGMKSDQLNGSFKGASRVG